MVHPGQVGQAGVGDQGAGVVQRCAKRPEAPSSLNQDVYGLDSNIALYIWSTCKAFAIGLGHKNTQVQIFACPSFGLEYK